MILDKKDREKLLLIKAERLKDIDGERTLDAMLQLNKLNLELCKASIKKKNPRIKDRALLRELNKIYWGNERT